MVARIKPSTRLPVVKQKDQKYKEAGLAFHTGEKHLPDGTKASDFVYDKLVEYYNKYNQTEYLAPYTSIVGPWCSSSPFPTAFMSFTSVSLRPQHILVDRQ